MGVRCTLLVGFMLIVVSCHFGVGAALRVRKWPNLDCSGPPTFDYYITESCLTTPEPTGRARWVRLQNEECSTTGRNFVELATNPACANLAFVYALDFGPANDVCREDIDAPGHSIWLTCSDPDVPEPMYHSRTWDTSDCSGEPVHEYYIPYGCDETLQVPGTYASTKYPCNHNVSDEMVVNYYNRAECPLESYRYSENFPAPLGRCVNNPNGGSHLEACDVPYASEVIIPPIEPEPVDPVSPEDF